MRWERRRSPDERLRMLERAALSGDPEARQRLDAELRRLGLAPPPVEADPTWVALLSDLRRGPLTRAARDVPAEHLDRLRREHQAWISPVGSRLVIGLADPEGRARYHDELQAARLRSQRAKRAAATRKAKRLAQSGGRPKPLPPWKRIRAPYREALYRLHDELSLNGGVIARSQVQLEALTGLHERELLRLLQALRDRRVPGWSITAELFDDEWVVTLGA